MSTSRPVAVVTGAGGGIGTGVCHLLERRGYDIVAVDVDQAAIDRITAQLGPGAIGVVNDAGRREQTDDLVARLGREWADRLEVVVCNAGIIHPADVVDAKPSSVRAQLDIMLDSPIQVMAAAAAIMKAKGHGKILATVSIGGVVAMPGSATYSAAKAGLRAFLAALAAELRHTDVSVSGIYPSGVDTPMLRHEALRGGSVLSFIGEILPPETVVEAYDRALDSGRLETYLPSVDGVASRLLAFSPQMGQRLLPLLERMGRRGLQAYLRRLDS